MTFFEDFGRWGLSQRLPGHDWLIYIDCDSTHVWTIQEGNRKRLLGTRQQFDIVTDLAFHILVDSFSNPSIH